MRMLNYKGHTVLNFRPCNFFILSNFSSYLLVLIEISEQLLVLKLAFLLYFTMFQQTIYEFPVKKGAKTSPLSRSWAQDKSSWAARQVVVRENSKWWTKIHTRRDLNVSGEEVRSTIFFGFNWSQSCLAPLLTPQNCTKMLCGTTFEQLS